MNHDHNNYLDAVISGGALVVSFFTSDKTLIFLSIVLVLIRIFVALKEKK
jgi:hypothetical protein